MRIKRGTTTNKRHKKVLKLAKGMQHDRTRSFRLAKQGVIKALQYAYRDRRTLKRDLRAIWITRINAGARELDVSYNQLISGLKKNNIRLNRKVLAELVVLEPNTFAKIVEASQK